MGSHCGHFQRHTTAIPSNVIASHLQSERVRKPYILKRERTGSARTARTFGAPPSGHGLGARSYSSGGRMGSHCGHFQRHTTAIPSNVIASHLQSERVRKPYILKSERTGSARTARTLAAPPSGHGLGARSYSSGGRMGSHCGHFQRQTTPIPPKVVARHVRSERVRKPYILKSERTGRGERPHHAHLGCSTERARPRRAELLLWRSHGVALRPFPAPHHRYSFKRDRKPPTK
jgi:ubiquitin